MLKVHGTFLQSQYSTESRYFKFKIQQSVRVTESFYPELSIAELFSSLGGVLGLWLGVSVIQVVEYGINMKSCLKDLNPSPVKKQSKASKASAW